MKTRERKTKFFINFISKNNEVLLFIITSTTCRIFCTQPIIVCTSQAIKMCDQRPGL